MRKTEMNQLLYAKFKERNLDSGRGSIVAYLWGMQLAKYIKELEQVKAREVHGFGQIVLRENEYQGVLSEEVILKNELLRY